MKSIRITSLEIGDEWFDGETFFFSSRSYKAFSRELQKESDRSIVLMSAAIIDNILQERLRSKCSHAPVKSVKRLFDVGGPFHTLSAKIQWLYCIGDLSQELAHDIHIIRDLRNLCAHNWQSFALDESVETQFLHKMKSHLIIDKTMQLIADKEKRTATHKVTMQPRLQFMYLSSLLISTLNAVHTRLATLDEIVPKLD